MSGLFPKPPAPPAPPPVLPPPTMPDPFSPARLEAQRKAIQGSMAAGRASTINTSPAAKGAQSGLAYANPTLGGG